MTVEQLIEALQFALAYVEANEDEVAEMLDTHT